MAAKETVYVSRMELIDLPNDCIVSIFKFMNFDEISQKRLVCRRFNFVCGHMLNAGLKRADEEKNREWRRIRSLVPRRESERRVHPLNRHLEVLSSLDTRVALLNMTYQRYIEAKTCPFIPGKVLDEIFNVLKKISGSETLPRSHEVLKELRDISSMAIEHFDEFIVPRLKEKEAVTHHCSPMPAPPAGAGDMLSPLEYLTNNTFMRQSGVTTAGTPASAAASFSASSTPGSGRIVRIADPENFIKRQRKFCEELKSLHNRVQDLERQSANKAKPAAAASSPEVVALTKQVKDLQKKLKDVEKRGCECECATKRPLKRKLELDEDEAGPSGVNDEMPAKRTRGRVAKAKAEAPTPPKAKMTKKAPKAAARKGKA